MKTATVLDRPEPAEWLDPPAPKRARLYFIDNLRAFIIIFVLIHHAANPYGSPDFWYYQSKDPRSNLVGLYLELAPSFTMAILLAFSGYLLPSSYDRHRFGPFVWDKLVRLGIPLVLGALILLPLMQYYCYHQNFAYKGYRSFGDYYWNAWLAMGERPPDWNGPGWPDRNLGHLWYIEHLLFYALCYGIWRRFFAAAERAERAPLRPPTNFEIFLFTLVIIAATFAVRIWFPLHKAHALLGFLQVDMSHFPQWLPFFFVGLACYRYGWIESLPRSAGLLWLGVGMSMLTLHFTLAHSPWTWLLWGEDAYAGGVTWGNLAKTTWESFFCVGMTVGLIVFFRELMNDSTPLRRTLAQNAYSVHVCHPPMVVAIQFLLGGLILATFWKFIVAASLGIVVCFAVSHYVIRRIPYVDRVL